MLSIVLHWWLSGCSHCSRGWRGFKARQLKLICFECCERNWK